MAGELAHKDVGIQVTYAEYHSVGEHVLDSQATGDLIYASSNTQLSRLAHVASRILITSGGIPAWSATLPAVTFGGAVDGGAQNINNLNALFGRTDGQLYIGSLYEASAVGIRFRTTGVSPGFAATTRLTLSGGVAEAIAQWADIIHTGLKLGGPVDLAGQAFDAGSGFAQVSTTGNTTLLLLATQDAVYGAEIFGRHVHSTPAANHQIFSIRANGYDLGANALEYGRSQFLIEDATEDHADGKYAIYLLRDQTATLAMSVSSLGVLSPANSVMFDQDVDSAAVADQVSISGYEIGAGHRALAISSEEVVVVDVDETKFSHKLPVRINGATYNIMLCAT